VRIGICLAALPRMLAEILVQLIESESDLVPVSISESPDKLSDVVREAELDAIILGIADGEEQWVPIEVMCTRPRLLVIGIENDGKNASELQLRSHVRRLGEMSPERLIEFLHKGNRDGEFARESV